MTTWRIENFALKKFVHLGNVFEYLRKKGGKIVQMIDQPVFVVKAQKKKLSPFYVSALDRLDNQYQIPKGSKIREACPHEISHLTICHGYCMKESLNAVDK